MNRQRAGERCNERYRHGESGELRRNQRRIVR
jgi:hypothetical protein